ncbi:MAG TPA: M13 family metallopeptidase [Saprospiraceae bacterium]|nr:M13 family metallopeptidase [Saprospiraceae bacterium]
MSRAVLFLLVACAGHFLAACADTTVGDNGARLSSGIYLDNLDTNVRPQDDFFQFVNGGWLASNNIPDDKSSDGSFERLSEAADADVLSIIEEAAAQGGASGSPEQRIAILYRSFMAEERINALGIQALDEDLSIIDAIDSERRLLEFFALAEYSGVTSPLEIYVMPDFLEPERYRLYLFQSGLGLPNSDYYTDDSEQGRAIVAAYHSYMRDVYMALGYSRDAADKATSSSWALELGLAAHHRPPEKDRNYPLWHNLYGPGHKNLPSGVNWDDYFSSFELSPETVISVAQPEYIEGLALVLKSTPLSAWRDYLKLRLVSSFAPYLSQELQDLAFDFYSTTLEGTPQMKPRWRRGVSFVNYAIGDSVGQIYVREHFSPSAKAQMDQLVANLIVAYRESIESLDWMGEQTRANALIKLDKFTANIGYPDKWKDYSTMRLGEALLPNVREANRWEVADQLARLPKPVDRHEWNMNVQTVNAYYSSVQNSINFPAAILQPPFFDPQVDEAIN